MRTRWRCRARILLRGTQGFAGQVGHTHFADNGIECSCGKSGCWVTEVGSEAVMRKLLAAGVDVSSGADADWVDLDGPLLLLEDREYGLQSHNGVIYPPERELWG